MGKIAREKKYEQNIRKIRIKYDYFFTSLSFDWYDVLINLFS